MCVRPVCLFASTSRARIRKPNARPQSRKTGNPMGATREPFSACDASSACTPTCSYSEEGTILADETK